MKITRRPGVDAGLLQQRYVNNLYCDEVSEIKLLAAVFIFAPFSLSSQERLPVSALDPRVETLAKRAADARVAGKAEVIFSLSAGILPEHSTGLANALSNYSVVIGTPTDRQVVSEDNLSLSTWYAIQVAETLSSRSTVMPNALRLSSLSQSLQPTRLLPITDGQILLSALGGSILIDGVTVTQRENGQESLQVGKRYLFIIDCSPDHIARLPFGTPGILLLKDDGDHLLPITPSRHPITNDVATRGFDSISRIRELLSGHRQ